MYVQKREYMVMVDFSCVHVVREVYEKIVAEDLTTPDASWKGDGCNTTVVLKRIDHGFFPKWFETTCVNDSLFGMYAKDINFGELVVFEECEVHLKKSDNRILNGDLQITCKMTNDFNEAEKEVKNMLKKIDPLIMCFKSLQIENDLLKVSACLIEIIV